MVLAFVFVSIVWYYRRVEIKYNTEVKNSNIYLLLIKCTFRAVIIISYI